MYTIKQNFQDEHYVMKKLNDWAYDVHLSKGRESPDLYKP